MSVYVGFYGLISILKTKKAPTSRTSYKYIQ